MRWYWPIFALSVALLFVGLALSYWFWPFLALGPLFWLIVGNSLRCPRCGKHVMATEQGYSAPWIKVPMECVVCQRRKEDVWPFQWLLRPEREPADPDRF